MFQWRNEYVGVWAGYRWEFELLNTALENYRMW